MDGSGGLGKVLEELVEDCRCGSEARERLVARFRTASFRPSGAAPSAAWALPPELSALARERPSEAFEGLCDIGAPGEMALGVRSLLAAGVHVWKPSRGSRAASRGRVGGSGERSACAPVVDALFRRAWDSIGKDAGLWEAVLPEILALLARAVDRGPSAGTVSEVEHAAAGRVGTVAATRMVRALCSAGWPIPKGLGTRCALAGRWGVVSVLAEFGEEPGLPVGELNAALSRCFQQAGDPSRAVERARAALALCRGSGVEPSRVRFGDGSGLRALCAGSAGPAEELLAADRELASAGCGGARVLERLLRKVGRGIASGGGVLERARLVVLLADSDADLSVSAATVVEAAGEACGRRMRVGGFERGEREAAARAFAAGCLRSGADPEVVGAVCRELSDVPFWRSFQECAALGAACSEGSETFSVGPRI